MNQRFGPYIVGETIGRGTFAKVKIAVHETTKVRVALKIISRKVVDNDAHSALKIKREIKVMSVLRHPHITRLYDVVQTKHDIVLVLEFISGGELFDFIIKRGRLDEPTARVLFQQIAAAVAYCHRYRIAHRDIKPENIMLEHGMQNIKLSDFGLASITHDGRFFESSCGTPNYASPEVVSGSLYGGPETDTWSCGVVLYAMTTGTLPFDDANVGSLFKKIVKGNYVLPRSLSRELRDLISRMLVVNPVDRATMEQVMQHPWLAPQFPSYLLSLHYEAVLDTTRFARDAIISGGVLDDEVVRVVASRFSMTTSEVAAIVSTMEEHRPSMWAVASGSGNGKAHRYPAANYWETFSTVLDCKLWPRPLEIVPAEVALRDQNHDIRLTYLILLQKRQSQLGPVEFAKKSFDQSATSLLHSQSQQGYGWLNANSLKQLSGNSSFTGSSLRDSISSQSHNAPTTSNIRAITSPIKKHLLGFDAHWEGKCQTSDEPWMEGYNTIAAPFLPLNSPKSQCTLLGRIFRVTELPVSLLKARHIEMTPISRVLVSSKSRSTAQSNIIASSLGGGSRTLLHPVVTAGDSTSEVFDLNSSFPTSGRTGGRNSSRNSSNRRSNGAAETSSHESPETALNVLYRVEVITRFGNDFIRHGVLFRNLPPQQTLKMTYAAMREEGLMWRSIHDFYFSAVRFPSIKLQVKMYKVSNTEQIVNVKVSVQSGMEALDAAVSLLERLRAKAVTQPLLKRHSTCVLQDSAASGSCAGNHSTGAHFSSSGSGLVKSHGKFN